MANVWVLKVRLLCSEILSIFVLLMEAKVLLVLIRLTLMMVILSA
jgi:hypothetical protein